MKLIKVKCPNCNSNVKVGENSKSVVCDYCKSEFLVDDGVVRTEKTIRDEARIKEAEVINEMQARDIAHKEKEKKNDRNEFLILLGFVLLLLAISGIYGLIHSNRYITMPESYWHYTGKNYKIVKSELEDLGFKNIEIRTIDDLVIGIFSQEEDVESDIEI